MVVDQVFHGEVEGGTRIEFSQIAIGEMGASPKVGERYLIYSKRSDGLGFGLGVCSGSRRFEWAGEDLAYARSLKGRVPKTSFIGVVAERSWPFVTDDRLAGVRIALSGDAGRYEVVTDVFGKFQFDTVPPGDYRLDAILDGYQVRAMYWGPEIRIPPSGCAYEMVVMEPAQ